MGNHFVCENYYCQSVSFKPEWLSESIWDISYDYLEDKKPYLIDKGILKISEVSNFSICFSKKLLIDFTELKSISIPINFKYNLFLNKSIDIFIILSNNKLCTKDINEKKETFIFSINMKLLKKKILIYRSFNDTLITKKIKSKKINTFDINIENNLNILLITEKLHNNTKISYENKYLHNYTFGEKDKDLYLSLFIKCENPLFKKEFIELNFE
jgi:hypothetical protein